MQQIKYLKARKSHWDNLPDENLSWGNPSSYYHDWIEKIYKFLVPSQSNILDIGCGSGDLLSVLLPARGVGIDLSERQIEIARAEHPGLEFHCTDIMEFETDEQFDAIIFSDVIGDLWDVQDVLERIKSWCHPNTRIIFNSFSRIWQLPIGIALKLRWGKPVMPQNWLTRDDLLNLLRLTGFEEVSTRDELLFPVSVPLMSTFVNKYVARIFPFNLLAMVFFVVARLPQPHISADSKVSVVVPARNEEGNVPDIFSRIPQMGGGTELIFVEGGSSDGTYEAAQKQITERPGMDARLIRQPGKGKGDAVRTGFAAATGDVLMILDADLTVPPEDLPRFFNVLVEGRAEYVNGVRLVYPMNDQAMRFFNLLGNKFFSMAFSWLLSCQIKDTLCGTKVMTRKHYEHIAANRNYFGDFDPFGDFDLIFGASKISLKFIDLPIRYRERTYGDTNISRWKHGMLLLRMFAFASKKIKFI